MGWGGIYAVLHENRKENTKDMQSNIKLKTHAVYWIFFFIQFYPGFCLYVKCNLWNEEEETPLCISEVLVLQSTFSNISVYARYYTAVSEFIIQKYFIFAISIFAPFTLYPAKAGSLT